MAANGNRLDLGARPTATHLACSALSRRLHFQPSRTMEMEEIMKRGPGAAEPKAQRVARRKRQPSRDRSKEERNRRKSLGGGQPNELGVIQGQNGEQGNTTEPRNATDLGRQ